MAITIKSVPVLQNMEAQRFIQKAETSARNRATVDFSEQIKTSHAILAKAKMR